MTPLIGTIHPPEVLHRHRGPRGEWEVWRVNPDRDGELGALDATFTGRWARLRAWVYVTFAQHDRTLAWP